VLLLLPPPPTPAFATLQVFLGPEAGLLARASRNDDIACPIDQHTPLVYNRISALCVACAGVSGAWSWPISVFPV
jgi:hypothetical protein